MVHLEPIVIRKQQSYNWGTYALNSTASSLTYLQRGCNPHSLLQSQKSGWISQKVLAGQSTQRIFSMTLLATYSLYLFAQFCEITGIDLRLTERFDCTSCPRRSDLPTLMSLVPLLEQDSTRKGRVYKHYKHYIQNTQNPILRGAAMQNYPAIRKVKRGVV